MNTNTLLTRLAALSLAIALGGCGGEPTAPAPEAVQDAAQAQTAANPDAPAGISITEGRLLLPAVKGNPGAVYFTIANTGASEVVISAVNVAGAGRAMLHKSTAEGGMASMEDMAQVPVASGAGVAFAPSGLHVMAMELDDSLAVGGNTEVTLTFANGDKASFPAQIRAPGDGS